MKHLAHKNLDFVLHEFDKGMRLWEPKALSSSTRKTYQSAIIKFHEYLEGVGTDLSGYGRVDVQGYVDQLKKEGKKASTINKVYSAIITFSKWMEKDEVVKGVNVVKTEQIRNKAPKSIEKLEKHRIIRTVEAKQNKRDIAIIHMLFGTGVRISELTSLKRSDIEMSERKGSVRVVGKGNKERTIPLNSTVRRSLKEYLETRTDDYEALLLSGKKQPISVRGVQYILRKDYGIHPHQLRHTFITDLVRQGTDFSVIQSLSGHENADMVMRYSRPSDKDKEDAVEGLD